MILDTIQSQIQDSMKAHDEMRVSTLKMLYSSLKYAKIEAMRDLTPDEELQVIAKEIKKRSDSIDAYTKANSPERVAQETKERDILREFLPPLMSDEEIKTLVDEAVSELGATEMKDMGRVISAVQEKVGLRAESVTIAKFARAKLFPQ
jgi:uncharacterized protein